MNAKETESRIDQRVLLLRKIEVWNAQFDPEYSALLQPFTGNTYHTTLRPETTPEAHTTLAAAKYAAALLDSGMAEYEERAFQVIRGLLPLQDQDPNSHTYGIWPWYYEEPLTQMSPPDWNWADFIGKQLVLMSLRHSGRIPVELAERIRYAVRCAGESIIRRNMGAHYTNIAIMGSLVTLIAGEHYGWQDFADYALERLKKILAHVEALGTFQEFNSPPYTKVAIIELSRIRQASRNPAAKELAQSLLDRAWRMVADHFHPKTKEWAGPHSRSYGSMLRPDEKGFLQLATEGKLSWYAEAEIPYDTECYGNDIRCPKAYLPLLTGGEERVLRQRYYREEETGLEKWAYTYISEDYCIASSSQDLMWNQSRPLLAYADNGGEPAYLRFRFLHDGYDYCSAVIMSSQAKGKLLLGIRFLTEGGDTHPNLDRIHGTIEASDFRLRLELGGCLKGAAPKVEGTAASVTIGRTPVRLDLLYSAFGDQAESFHWRVTEEADTCGLDLVLHEGGRKTIDFTKLRKAALLLSLRLGEDEGVPVFRVEESEEEVTAYDGEAAETSALSVSLPLSPSAAWR